MEISFSQMQLIQTNQSSGETYINPNISTFGNLDKSFSIKTEDNYYEVVIEKTNDYIWFSFDYNKPEPRDENITNINTGEKRNNERTTEDVELIHQVFFLYHYQSNLLYVSNSQKKKLIEQVLKEKLQIDFIVKSMFKTPDEFIAVLNKCNKIEFTHTNNLFSQNSKKRQALIDLTGTDAPENFTISAGYNGHTITNFIRGLFQEKKDEKIAGLTICGLDETGFDFVYNTESFTKKVKINADKDANGKFQSDNVKTSLIQQIGNL